MPGRDPWRNRKIVRIVAAIDCCFAIALMILYSWDVIQSGISKQYEFVSDDSEDFQPGEKLITKGIKYLGFMFVNTVQLLLAYQLFYAVKEGRQESQTSISKATCWQRFSNIIFLVLIGKLIMIAFFGSADGSGRIILFGINCLLELIFKAIGMYFVKEFIDDLKSAFVAPAPRIQFLSFFTASEKRQNNEGTTPAQV